MELSTDGEAANMEIELGQVDVRAVLQTSDWRSWVPSADGPRHAVADLDYATLIPTPDKMICVGLNYRDHILETGNKLPDYPTLFNKFSGALIGANDPIAFPTGESTLDWEAELGVVIGAPVRHADDGAAHAAIAGWTIVNDVTVRAWQYRTGQWMQGKTFEGTTPVGPWLVVSDDGVPPAVAIECSIGAEQMQSANTGNLLFGAIELVRYASSFITLLPGDIIATGTPGGVGHARTPARFLQPGEVVITRIEGIGECRNLVTA